jgi:hypothetical protein
MKPTDYTTIAIVKIPVYEKNLLTHAVNSLLWIKNYLEELKNDILKMIWRELFKNETDDNQLIHLIAFIVFSVFSWFAYHQGIEDYVVYLFYALWPLDYLFASYISEHPRYIWVTLKTQGEAFIWQKRTAKGSLIDQRRFSCQQIHSVRLRAETYQVSAYSTVKANVWEIFVQLVGEEEPLIIDHKTTLKQGLRKAINLTQLFKVPLCVADSCGQGSFAETQTPPLAVSTTWWNTCQNKNHVEIRKNLATVNIFKLTQAILDKAGVFIFLAVMAEVMKHYGRFLAWFLDSDSSEPDLYLELSLEGILSFFTPNLSWHSGAIFAITLTIIFYTVRKNTHPQMLMLTPEKLSYRVAGNPGVTLLRTELRHILLLYSPKPMLLLISKKQLLIIDNLYNTEELEELYSQLMGELEN